MYGRNINTWFGKTGHNSQGIKGTAKSLLLSLRNEGVAATLKAAIRGETAWIQKQ